jgi:tRNA G37 N-methylase Trm5
MNQFKTLKNIGKAYRFADNRDLIGDNEGLLFTNYQKASIHTALRIKESLGEISILELCCGVGGMTVFLAKYHPKIIAVDLNEKRIEAAKINAKTFGVGGKTEFIIGDVLDEKLLLNAKQKGVQTVVIDVEWRDRPTEPWNSYASNIANTIPSTTLLFEKVNRLVTSNIIMHMAPNVIKSQLRQLGRCEIEEISLQGKIKFLNVYFGELIKTSDSVFSLD